MKKLFLIILSFGLFQSSSANYLNNWPNEALCSWMDSPSPPEYMVEEVKIRNLACHGGIVIYPPDPNPPDPNPPDPNPPDPNPPDPNPPDPNPPDPNPPDPNPPIVKNQPIRPGWKIAEGSNFWTIDESDTYWQTEEGSQKVDIRNQKAIGILNQQVMIQQQKQAADYAQENPGVEPPTSSYYATDPCGEGKQPANASC